MPGQSQIQSLSNGHPGQGSCHLAYCSYSPHSRDHEGFWTEGERVECLNFNLKIASFQPHLESKRVSSEAKIIFSRKISSSHPALPACFLPSAWLLSHSSTPGPGLLPRHPGLLLQGEAPSCGFNEQAPGQGSGAGRPPFLGGPLPHPHPSHSGSENAAYRPRGLVYTR